MQSLAWRGNHPDVRKRESRTPCGGRTFAVLHMTARYHNQVSASSVMQSHMKGAPKSIVGKGSSGGAFLWVDSQGLHLKKGIDLSCHQPLYDSRRSGRGRAPRGSWRHQASLILARSWFRAGSGANHNGPSPVSVSYNHSSVQKLSANLSQRRGCHSIHPHALASWVQTSCHHVKLSRFMI